MQMDFREIQQLLREGGRNFSFSFEEAVSYLQNGNLQGFFVYLLDCLKQMVLQDELFHLHEFKQIFLLIFLSVLLHVCGEAFTNKTVTLFSRILIQLVLIIRMAVLFESYRTQVSDYLETGTRFTITLFPILTAAAAAGGETATAAGAYAFTASVTTLLLQIGKWMLLPGITLYFVLTLFQSLGEKPVFSELVKLLNRGLQLGMNLFTGFVLGGQVLQLMILPKTDAWKRRLFIRSAAMVPGIGTMAEAAAGSVWDSASLLKSSIGAAGLAGLFFICFLPICRLIAGCLICQIMGALLHPVADQNVCQCMKGLGDTFVLMIRLMILAAVLEIILIAAAAW